VAIVTGKRTQLTIVITGGATTLGMEYKTMLRAERAEFVLVCDVNKDSTIKAKATNVSQEEKTKGYSLNIRLLAWLILL